MERYGGTKIKPYLYRNPHANVRKDIKRNKRHSNTETDTIKLNIRQNTLRQNQKRNEARVEIDNMTEDVIQTKINNI